MAACGRGPAGLWAMATALLLLARCGLSQVSGGPVTALNASESCQGVDGACYVVLKPGAYALPATSITRNLTLGGSNSSTTSVQAPGDSPFTVGAGISVTFVNVTLVDIAVAYTPAVGLQPSGITVGRGAAVTLQGVTVRMTACGDWVALRSAICDDGQVFGNLQAFFQRIMIDRLDDVFGSALVGWRNVQLLPPNGPACVLPPGAVPSCVTKSFVQGADGADVLSVLTTANTQTQAASNDPGPAPRPASAPGSGPAPARPPQQQQIPRIFIQLQLANSVLAMAGPSSTQLNLYYNTTIKGMPGASPIPELDVRLASDVLRIQGSGLLTIRNLALINMPTEPASYPLGMLTCLPWFVSGLPNPSQDSSNRLLLNGVSLILPVDELHYMWQWVSEPGQASKYISEDYMKNTGPPGPSLNSNGTTLRLESVDGRQGVWKWNNVLLYASDDPRFSTPRSMNWSGLPTMLQLPKEVSEQQPCQLSQISQVPAILNLSAFNISSSREMRPPYSSVHYIMHGSSGISDPSLVSNVQLSAEMLIAGDPLHPTQFMLDLSSANADTNGVVTLNPAANARLYLRSMLLLNAQPARPVGTSAPRAPVPTPPPIQSGRKLLQRPAKGFEQGKWAFEQMAPEIRAMPDSALYNFTTLLWMFRTSRSPECSAADPPPNCALLNLTNVTIVVPPVELQLLRTLARPGGVAMSVNWGLSLDAANMLAHQLNASTFDQRTWSGLDMEGNVTSLPALPSTDQSTIPGDIIFEELAWFGMVGNLVTFTSLAPAEALLMQEVQQLLGGVSTAGVVAAAPLAPGSAQLPKPPVAPNRRPLAPPNNRPTQMPQPPYRPGSANAQVPDPAPDTSTLAGWQLALVIVGSVVVAAAVGAALAVWALRSTRSRRTIVEDKAASPSELAMASAFAPYAQPGLGGGYCDNPLMSAAKTSSPAGSSAMGDGNSSGYPGTSLFVPAAIASSVRQDTEDLLGEIFRDTDREGTPLGSVVSTAPGSTATPRAAGLSNGSDVSASVLAALAAAADPRHKIQREISLMRDELHGNCSPWEVQGQLGKGAFGVVYKGTWRGLEVAIKRVIFQVLSADSNAETTRHTALREAAINATLDHPHIVATYTYDMQPLGGNTGGGSGGVSDWQMYIVQEYCDGGSLFDAIQQRKFHAPAPAPAAAVAHDFREGETDTQTEVGASTVLDAAVPGKVVLRDILAIASDIASGCAYIHSKNIIHGDLKPDNVLLKIKPLSGRQSWQDGSTGVVSTAGPGCVAKVADFGMSMNIRGNNTHISGVRHGTPLYIPPEILRNGKASKSADVYSFGVIMWELYHGISAWQHLIQVTGGPVKKRNLLTFQPDLYAYDMRTCELPAYAELGRACLNEDPTARPTFNEVLAALETMKARLEAGVDVAAQVPEAAGMQVGQQDVILVSDAGLANSRDKVVGQD